MDEIGQGLESLASMKHFQRILDERIGEQVVALREQGATWTQIANALGITQQGAHKRWAKSTSDNEAVKEPGE